MARKPKKVRVIKGVIFTESKTSEGRLYLHSNKTGGYFQQPGQTEAELIEVIKKSMKG